MAISGISAVAPIGKRFGRLAVVSGLYATPRSNSRKVDCRCDCGDVSGYFIANLRSRENPACVSCRQSLRPSKGLLLKHPLANIWKGMIQRCENPNHDAFHLYGGRGITVCDRWRSDFTAFAADMGDRPSAAHTVDRLDNDGNYEPKNCAWATSVKQGSNRSTNVQIEWQGRRLTIAEAAREIGMSKDALGYRLRTGWTVERAMTTPLGRPRSAVIALPPPL